ncbi:peptide ABC transporter substrate-binding protein [Metabacillus sp. RGM 3146]|uniref:peptide ABC transporter substrate-binding protein n=1 Tax=Metabacillus sp. RGM 3146 TaxID=3401092 RepID=UPI003B9B9F3E
MKKSKFSLFLGLILVLSLFLSACYGGKSQTEGKPAGGDSKGSTSEETAKPSEPQELKMLTTSETPTMDSVLGQDQASFTILNNTNEGLYRLDKDQNAIPGVADGKSENKDNKEFTVKLKKDAKWSNGDPITAHDFVYSWQRQLDPAVASPYGPYMMIGKVKNANEVYTKKVKPDQLGIVAVDDYTLKITFDKPIPYFEKLMSFPSFFPQNQKYVEKEGKNFAKDDKNILYNGPYKLTNWEGPADTEWNLEKNPSYWGAKDVKLDKVDFTVQKDGQAAANAFDAGEADVTGKLATPQVISQYEGSPELSRYLEPSVWWIKMNEKNPALKNKNIRKAIAMAVDKKSLVDDVLQNGSIPADFIVPKEWKGGMTPDGKDFQNGAKYLETNKAEAAKLWAQGLKEIGKSSLTFTYVGQDTASAKVTDAFIKDQLQKTLPGLKLKVVGVPFKIRLDREDKQDYDLLLSGWGPDYDDPMTWLDLWITDGGQNHMSYSNPEYDKLIQSADKDPDTANRFKTLQAAEKLALDGDAALAPMYQRALNVLQKTYVKGLVHHDLGGEYSFQWTTIEGKK